MILITQGIWYFFGTRPSPFFGITDFYVLDPVSRRTNKKWRVADLGLRERLGGGNFGQVYEGVIANKDIELKKVKQLTSKQKKRRVVLKKVNLDRVEVRADFLRSGTMAKVSHSSPIYHPFTTHHHSLKMPQILAGLPPACHTPDWSQDTSVHTVSLPFQPLLASASTSTKSKMQDRNVPPW